MIGRHKNAPENMDAVTVTYGADGDYRVWGVSHVWGVYVGKSCQVVTRANRNCEDNTMRKT